jgi:diguanylate cyclase
LIRIKKENKQIYNSLIYDKLSTLYSRQYFLEILEQRIELGSREEIFDCIMFFDVDNFKSVNDELGHNYGDNLISYVGETLHNYSRKTDICARYGGDEFLILLEN